MDVEVAQHLLGKVSSALIRFGTPPAEPAPKLTSWEEFLRQPTAAERAAADACVCQGAEPIGRPAPESHQPRESRRRRRTRTQTSPPKTEPRATRPSRATKPNETSNASSLTRTYDITAADNSAERIKHASAPRHISDAVRCPAQPSPSPSPPTASASAATVQKEITTVRRLLEQLVQSQLRVESRLDALQRNARLPATEEVPREVEDDGKSEPPVAPPDERERVTELDESSPDATAESLREYVVRLQASLLAVSRQLSVLSDRVSQIERQQARSTARRSSFHRSRHLHAPIGPSPIEQRALPREETGGPAP